MATCCGCGDPGGAANSKDSRPCRSLTPSGNTKCCRCADVPGKDSCLPCLEQMFKNAARQEKSAAVNSKRSASEALAKTDANLNAAGEEIEALIRELTKMREEIDGLEKGKERVGNLEFARVALESSITVKKHELGEKEKKVEDLRQQVEVLVTTKKRCKTEEIEATQALEVVESVLSPSRWKSHPDSWRLECGADDAPGPEHPEVKPASLPTQLLSSNLRDVSGPTIHPPLQTIGVHEFLKEKTCLGTSCTEKVVEKARKTRNDKGKLLKHRACPTKFLSKTTKYESKISLEEIDKLREQASLMQDEKERRKELNKLGALRSRRIRSIRIEQDAEKITKTKTVLRQSTTLTNRLIGSVTSLVTGRLAAEEEDEFGYLEDNLAALWDVFDDISNHNQLVEEVLKKGEEPSSPDGEDMDTTMMDAN